MDPYTKFWAMFAQTPSKSKLAFCEVFHLVYTYSATNIEFMKKETNQFNVTTEIMIENETKNMVNKMYFPINGITSDVGGINSMRTK